jgi:hypothetical protein
MNSMCKGELFYLLMQNLVCYQLDGIGRALMPLLTRNIGIKKSRGCDAEEMQLTYKPGLQSTNRPNMCPDGFCSKLARSTIENSTHIVLLTEI